MSQPVVHLRLGGDGLPTGASATARLERPIARVWQIVADVERYPGRVPMIERVRKEGERVTVDLKFKVSFVSVGFQFAAAIAVEPERSLELTWVAGEPRAIRLRFSLEPLAGGRACRVTTDGEFDVRSLGWMAKYFLKHHPEIQHGVYPGVALALLDSIRRAAEAD